MSDTNEQIVMRDYQVRGSAFLRGIRRGFLTDDPGLGKTVQAAEAAVLPAMVVAPKYLTGQWEDFLSNRYPDLVVAHADGTRTQRDKILSKVADWYVINIEMARSYALPTDIATFINDESQHLRNAVADQSVAVKLLENRNPESRIYNLTATPMWKSVADIWHQAHILYPQVFTSYNTFVKLYCVSMRGHYGNQVVGIRKNMRGPLKELFSPIMMGRTYKEVGRFLPPTIESVIDYRLPPQSQSLYDNLVKNASLEWATEEGKRRLIFNPMALLHALRQVTALSGKFEVVQNILADNVKDHAEIPSVIGLNYIDHAKELGKILGSSAVVVTGEMDAVDRQRAALRAMKEGKHLIASQKSLREGLNLQDYRQFIFAEEDYVPGSNHQFLSRVVRDRNDDGKDMTPVRVYYVHAKKTVDRTIHAVAKGRKTAIEAVRALLETTLGA